MKVLISKIVTHLRGVDPITGFPEHILLGYSDVFAQSEHLARYLFATSYAKGLILDVAAGSGYGSSILAKSESNYVVSSDLDTIALSYGKRVFRRENVDAVCCHAEYLPFRNASFDAIVSIETLEHLREPSSFLKEANRVMKPSRLMILSTPNKNVTSPVLSAPLNPHHFKEYELRESMQMLENQGIKVAAIFFQTQITLFRFFVRAIGTFLAFLLMKLGISLVPLREFLEVFRFQHNKLLDPDPSLYPISAYDRILDCLTHFQLIIVGQKSGKG